MRYAVAAALTLGLLLTPVSGQGLPLPREIVPATERMSNRVVLLVDVSGSMAGERINQALDGVVLMLSQPVDDLQVAVIAFDGEFSRWPGAPDPAARIPEGWASFPDVPNLEAVKAWLGSFKLTGITSPAPAMSAALALPERRLSIVLITDGEFPSPPLELAWAVGQATRQARDLPPAHLTVYGVGTHVDAQKHLVRLGERGRGGFWVGDYQQSGPW